ncbi:hypothetical protein DDZ18_06550 [Marinicauda salina]|uniref:LptF/LptG family permease n=1 Tax=Marinicauda salina TaxID=2135793 RepID=A0A2U2BTL3_9PROT|nr:LptF/LptG family permease [Marinicauda salina]PWE17340.1 hypothetical protein DDZ18_06550 [Marinicauda salina]
MKLFQRYVFRQALWPFLTAILALSALAILTQSLSNLDLITDEGGTALLFAWITLLAMPQVIALIVPIALFIGCAVALNRLTTDSEFIVGAAAGLSRFGRLTPFIRLAIYVALANLVINLFVQPASFREMRQALYEIRTDLAASFMREGEFVPLGGEVTFFAREIGENRVMHDIFIEDGRGRGGVAYSASEGVITQTAEGPVMLLNDGVLTQIDENGELSTLSFERYEFDLTAFIDPGAAFFFKESDKYLSELLDPTATDLARASSRDSLLAEGHYRLSSPLYNIAFALIAAAAYFSVEFRRTGYGRFIAAASAAALMLRLLGFAVQAAAAGDSGLNALQYAVPVLGSIGAVLVISRPMRRFRAAGAHA